MTQPQSTARTESAAKTLLREKLGKLAEAGASTQIVSSTSSVSKLLDEWLPVHTVELSRNSYRLYETAIRRHINPHLGDLTMQELDTPTVQAFLISRSPATAKTCRAVLGSSCSYAMRMGAILNNPVRETVLPRKKRKVIESLTDAEIVSYRSAVDSWVGSNQFGPPRGQLLLEIVDVCIGTGARIGEVLALRWEDVDLTQSTITVSGTAVEGPGRQPWTKNQAGYRTIPVAPVAANALARAHVHRLQSLGGEMVFPSAAGSYRTVRNTEDMLRAARKRGPIEIQKVTPHSFRRTVATRIAERHGSAYLSSQYLGHASTAVTEASYIAKPSLVDTSVLGALPAIYVHK